MRMKRVAEKCTLSSAVTEFYAFKRAQKIRERTLYDYQRYIDPFVAQSSNSMNVTVLKREILAYFANIPTTSPARYNHPYQYLHAFFGWCTKQDYMMTHPGKKLNFMGNELAMFREWEEKREPDWNLLKMPAHDSFHRYIGELNQLYLKKKAVWALDHTYDGFKWVDCKSANKCVFGYTRTDGKQTLLVLFNFSDTEATIVPELDGKVTMLLNTDWEPFGGSTKQSTQKRVPEKIAAFCGYLFLVQPN